MKSIAFFDTEVEPESGKILDIGCIKGRNSFHSGSIREFSQFLEGSEYICGHNILNHDLKYIPNSIKKAGIDSLKPIDTLFLSPLLFPAKPYHSLLKDDKLQTNEVNNPLIDSIKARDLFNDEVATFKKMDNCIKKIYYLLLKNKREFCSFFTYLGYGESNGKVEDIIHEKFYSRICENADIKEMIQKHPIEMAYCLALINTNSRYSITPPWVLKSFPAVEQIMYLLRNKPCLTGCSYCNQALDIHKGLKRFFGFNSYRTFEGKPLQEKAVKAAIENKSLLAVFPTGGGKSVTFQVPALMSGVNTKGLTVVISPLQSLMKDQVDNLEKSDIIDAVTINGLLDPIERAKSLERVVNGSASLLYISPESLRSRTIERVLSGRNIVRFVIDEAHCFSSWGQDFRVDYLYIGDFIKKLQQKKNLDNPIPVSCFTATAKQKVIEEIRSYFRKKLSLDLEVFRAGVSRKNLHYKVVMKDTKEDKYNALRDLIGKKNCPVIVYVSRTRRAYQLSKRLAEDGYPAKPYHGKMDKKEKTENQNGFIRGDVQVIVATSAFGMGVDKKDVGMVIHYDISDSLENYVQEAGRAGRDESVSADCYVLFNDDDLNKHFILLNQTKLSIQEIQQVWKAIKNITKYRSKVSQSALEIARKAGWDDNIMQFESKVKVAIAALEDAGYLKREQNTPRIYANSILYRNAYEAIKKIEFSGKFNKRQKVNATRIIRMIFSSKTRKEASKEEAESRVDYISDRLGIEKWEIVQIINLLREEKILADAKDLTAFIKRRENKNRSLEMLKSFWRIERFLLTVVDNREKVLHIKELNEQALEKGYTDVTPSRFKTILNLWAIKNWIKKKKIDYSKNHIAILCQYEKDALDNKLTKRHELTKFILEYLFEKTNAGKEKNGRYRGEEVLTEFSILELKEAFKKRLTIFKEEASIDEIEDALFYLSRIEALKIEGGFMVIYNAMTIRRIEKNNRKRYKVEDYRKLDQFYQNKIQQIHIVGEYARKMIDDYKTALRFVEDYFQLNYTSFLKKYFKGNRQDEINRNITPAKFRQIFGELSPTQLKIINERKSQYIVVAAGPGSGKTRILVHKMASLVLMEDVKLEQLLMLTFSRSSATEFKKRLLKLIGNAANYIEIKTFHSYCFDLLGRIGTIEKSDNVIKEAIAKIKNSEVEASRITKTVLVIDEAQDINTDEFALIDTLMKQNEDMRVVAVGDDDQNIFEFRGADSKYLKKLIFEKNACMYELVRNYRSKSNIVSFANQYLRKISNRLKSTPLIADQEDKGQIRIVRYTSTNLISPLVNDILLEELTGTTCVLTRTNEEALQITGLLSNQGIQAKLIQTNDCFNLYNLLEIRFFLGHLNLNGDTHIIDDNDWEYAKRMLKDEFIHSANLEICLNLLRDFEITNPKYKYKTDLEVFVRESKLEDFLGEDIETVFVSTIHKAKGREFDNIFLLLDQFRPDTEEELRQLYVAITRAKSRLIIHLNGNYLNMIKTPELQIVNDTKKYRPPHQLSLQLFHQDVWLDWFFSCQNQIRKIVSGDILKVNQNGCFNSKGETVLRYSRNFMKKIKFMEDKNYFLKTAKVLFVVYWKKENHDREIRILLPQLNFKRYDN